MVRKTIPETTTINCDMCGVVCDDKIGVYRMRTVVKVKCAALSMLGDPVANGDFEVDLCDKCSNRIYDILHGNEE